MIFLDDFQLTLNLYKPVKDLSSGSLGKISGVFVA